MMKRNCSYHITQDRPYRTLHILSTVGIGEIIKEQRCVDDEGRVSWQCFTDTGVILVLSENRTIVITLYIASQPKVSAMYQGKTPSWILRMVKKNTVHASIQNNVELLKQIYGEI